MGKEMIHLADGSTIQAEVNGNLRRDLENAREIVVVKRADSGWEEVKKTV